LPQSILFTAVSYQIRIWYYLLTGAGIWDLVMDWSLLDFTAPKFLLRPTLAYHQTWIYYAAMIIDPILRFNWVFYAIYANDLQHSTFISFAVGLSEVLRRGMWTVFRVENEHCTNVGRFRASRDVPLPFEVHEETHTPVDEENASLTAHTAATGNPIDPSSTQEGTGSPHLARIATGSDRSRPSPSLRLRKAAEHSPLVRGLSRVGSVLHLAHAQDFERRKRSEVENALLRVFDSDSSDDEGERDRHLRLPENIISRRSEESSGRTEGGRVPEIVMEEDDDER
jgi:xenotropic and polytropic retrovirus receptor 1